MVFFVSEGGGFTGFFKQRNRNNRAKMGPKSKMWIWICRKKRRLQSFGFFVLKVSQINHRLLYRQRMHTCTEEGNKAYYICDRCDKWFEDAQGKSEITDKTSVIIPAAGHTLSDWKADDNSHGHECECGYKAYVAQHSFKWVVDKEANATQKGAKHEKCTVCGYKRAAVEIPATGTTIAPTTTPKKDSTTTSTSAVNNPKTGDNSNIFLWIVLLLISGGTVICIIVYNKKRKYNMK